MARREFPIKIRREAVKRAAGRCEAIGADYGLAPGKRCNGNLGSGFDYDHIIADSIGGEPTLENCAVVCKPCHRRKTAEVDTPRAAKTKRQADMSDGVRKEPHPNFRRPKGSHYDWSRGGRLVRGDAR